MRKPEWTPDCCGKWDYDCDIVSLSCRYWPRGGSHIVFDTSTGRMETGESRPHIKPHAAALIIIDDVDDPIARADFDGETEQEVKAKVEAWSAEMMGRAVAALRREFQEKESK